jgi:hypothetical protein
LFLAQTKKLSQNFRKKVATGEGEREREIQWLAGRSLTDPKEQGKYQTTKKKKKLNISNKQAYHSFKIS